ncbi:glutamate ABC transporter substrate-binding protein [Streptomyces sp. NPDC002144]|uniref:glutamate ABC transporter substrate-binding protein n=1 Tax=Streptomyces sp. NPDC006668 TaxID=3156903 RepID=UPI0033FB2B55
MNAQRVTRRLRLTGRLRSGLRGWGGVGAMAAVCALAVAFALLLPLTQSDGAASDGGQRLAHGTQAKAEDCKDPQNQSLSPSGGDGSTPDIDRIKKARRLIVGVDTNSYRWGYLNPNNVKGELEGFDIDLAHQIAKDLLGDPGLVSFKAIPTNQRIPAIQHGEVDMVVRTMTITCKRLGDVAFSAPYFSTGQQVLAPKTSTITGYDDSLAGKKVCSAEGSTAYDNLKADRGAKIPASTDISTQVPNQLDCLVKLQLGEVDAVVTDGALAASQAAQDPTVELKGRPFTHEYYGVAMKKGYDDLVRQVNRTLENYIKSGGWQASYAKWLHPTLDQPGQKSDSATPPEAHYK